MKLFLISYCFITGKLVGYNLSLLTDTHSTTINPTSNMLLKKPSNRIPKVFGFSHDPNLIGSVVV